MEKNKSKIKEPFPPENTPEPPQVMDTSRQPESGTKENEQAKSSTNDASGKEKKKEKDKSVGDAPDIDDETTI